mmetsp:Transcript_29101/g.61895  ORF Transcript_29101/g.61895 Transcript_29101/m.61895 type:complete len:431 (+) Transcript_29101:134-1426(+)
MTPTITTSAAAHVLAQKLVTDYNRRKQKERDLNKKKEAKAAKAADDSRRTVSEIDYKKHEDTVKELDRQEKEEAWQKKKEEASQWCTLDHEHGPHCRRPTGSCSHDHQKEWQIYEKSTEEKIQAADRFREEGNEYYRKHNYGLAAVQYRKALLQFDYTFANNEEEERQVEAVKVPCLLNLAACKCQQEDWDEVLTHCRLALEINPRSVKAFYRIGLAHLARDNFEEAKDALTSALEIEPKNPDVMGAYKRLRKNMETYKVRQKEVAKEMLAGKRDDDDQPEDTDVHEGQSDAATTVPPTQTAVEAQAPSATVADPAPTEDDNVVPEPAAITSSENVEVQAAETELRQRKKDDKMSSEGQVEVSPKKKVAEEVVNSDEEATDDEDDSDEDDDAEIAKGKMLNYVLLGAAGLALISLTTVVLATTTTSAGEL